MELSRGDRHDGDEPPGAPDRPLGRGLEDVSHLFLSPRAGDAATRSGARIIAPGSDSCAGETAVPVRPIQITRDRLACLLPLDWSGALEDGLRTIDTRIPCHPCGEIDVLAVDRARTVTIIDFDAGLNDGLLVRGLGHVDWVLRNASNVQRMCPGHALDASRPPRLILLAPQFSPLLRRVMRQVSRPQIQWVRYHAVDTPAGAGLLLEPVTGE